MTDDEHAKAIRKARTALCNAINAARAAGLSVHVKFDSRDTCGEPEHVRDGDFMTEVQRKL